LAALPLVAAAWHDGDGLRIHEVRAPLDERGAFSFQVPIGFAGVVELRCAESLIADAPWRPGDGLVSFSVDVAALRAHAGAIDVLADRRVDVTVHRVGDALRFPGLEPLADVEAASGRVTLDALWPATYLVVATPEGSAPSVRRVNVAPGSTVSVPVEPRAPVARRVHVFGLAPDDVSPFLDEVTAATRE